MRARSGTTGAGVDVSLRAGEVNGSLGRSCRVRMADGSLAVRMGYSNCENRKVSVITIGEE